VFWNQLCQCHKRWQVQESLEDSIKQDSLYGYKAELANPKCNVHRKQNIENTVDKQGNNRDTHQASHALILKEDGINDGGYQN